MQGGDDHRRSAGIEGVDIDCDGRHDEDRRGDRDRGPRQAALPAEVAGHERQDDQSCIEGEGCCAEQLKAGLRRQAGRHGHDQHDGQFAAGAGAPGRGGGDQHELLPEPIGVFPGELLRDLVQAAHALDRDQERLLVVQAGSAQLIDSFA
ncbi:hypothetical protein SDC9_154394 [bioreactor metagenome]|uniref:Uncharacterized protein n=1 Tax=bioreactor metagenome TaxID=1076179 RepID=A0A645EYK1_9ZZZZ